MNNNLRTRRNIVFFLSLASLLVVSLSNCKGIPGQINDNKIYWELTEHFSTPPDSIKPWVYWYWINDDISKDGVTKDLEAMKRVGIGAALIGNINPEEKDGKVPILSEAWWETMVHAVKEGHRLGVDIGVFNCPGWSQSGGPWVTSDKAMRYVSYSSTKVEGPGQIVKNLDRPTKDFQDTFVLAYPIGDEFRADINNATISTNPNTSKNKAYWFDNDITTGVPFDLTRDKNFTIDFKLKNEQAIQNLSLTPMGAPFKCDCKLEAFENGQFNTIREFKFDRQNLSVNVGPIQQGELSIAFAPNKSSNFRLTCSNIVTMPGETIGENNNIGFSELKLSTALQLDHYVEKQLGKMHPTPQPNWDSYHWESQGEPNGKDGMIDPSSVRDISEFMDSTGVLKWAAPKGKWLIQRFGMSPTGTKNSPSAPQGKGFEIDKMNDSLARFHFENFVGELLKRIPPDAKDAFKYVVADSYEMGSTNWTDGFRKKFKDEYNYDPIQFLPVISGKIVKSVDASERFLWDLRRLVANRVAYEYVGGLRKVSNENGLKLWLENYGHWGFPSEFLMYGGQSDLVSGEFWNEGSLGDIECRSASSAAHIYGKKRISAEAFTSAYQSYLRHPSLLKRRGDWSFTEGINHFVLHLYIHQPDDIRIPGVNAWFGTEFNRHNTWFEQSKSWIDYLRRCQVLLESGDYVADVAYFIGEDTPIMTGERKPELPKGYAYDYINAEVILDSVLVQDNRMFLPNGISYGMLVLPPTTSMRPEVLEKILLLAENGVPVFGNLPNRSPSYASYPNQDHEVLRLSQILKEQEFFSTVDVAENPPQKMSEQLQMALKNFGIQPDVILPKTATDKILWTHRRIKEEIDIYFLTNQSGNAISVETSFRVIDKKPQLWNALTGEIRGLPNYTVKNGRTLVPLEFENDESWFVVFANEISASAKEVENFPPYKAVAHIQGPWEVQFENSSLDINRTMKFNTLENLSLSENDSLKYYSGNIIYKGNFQLKEIPDDKEIFINLGEVGVIGGVKINGIDMGSTWIKPYRLSLKTTGLKTGINSVEITVSNLWRNRLKGDLELKPEEKNTWLLVSDVEKDEKLPVSGLLGPVTIETR